MGEISTLEEAERIIPMGFDLISTTLSGVPGKARR